MQSCPIGTLVKCKTPYWDNIKANEKAEPITSQSL